MEKPETQKEGSLDRADPGEDGAWVFVRGKDALLVLRRWARSDSGTRWLGVLLHGALVYAVWRAGDRIGELCQIMRAR